MKPMSSKGVLLPHHLRTQALESPGGRAHRRATPADRRRSARAEWECCARPRYPRGRRLDREPFSCRQGFSRGGHPAREAHISAEPTRQSLAISSDGDGQVQIQQCMSRRRSTLANARQHGSVTSPSQQSGFFFEELTYAGNAPSGPWFVLPHGPRSPSRSRCRTICDTLVGWEGQACGPISLKGRHGEKMEHFQHLRLRELREYSTDLEKVSAVSPRPCGRTSVCV